MKERLRNIQTELSVDKACEHIEWLTANTPTRIAAMGDDVKAAHYVVERLREYGWDAGLHEYEAYNSHPGTASLAVLSPEKKILRSEPCCHIDATPPEGLEAELINVGAGAESDYEGVDAAGKFVLVEVSYSPATPEKARIAAAKGVAGMVCMNWGGDQPVICMRALKAVWGNPTEKSFLDIPHLAGLTISRKDGEYLQALCANGTVVVNMKSQADRRWDRLVQPFAHLTGGIEPEKYVLVAAHLDAWTPGVTCNATGDATVLEIARVLGRYKGQFRRSIHLEFWNGHEIAEAAGSTWYVDRFWDDARKNCVAYINIDSSGMLGAAKYTATVSRELSDFVRGAIAENAPGEPEVKPLLKTGDQSFFGVGVPAVAGRVNFDPETIKKNYGATLGWWNHTVEDGLDKVGRDNLKVDLRMDAALIVTLAESEVLPYDFTATCDDIAAKLESIDQESGGAFGIDTLIAKANCLKENIKRLNAVIRAAKNGERTLSPENAADINDTLMALSRLLTNAFYTCTSPYEQDSYGLTALSKPIPILYRYVELAKLPADSEAYRLLYTTLMKNRNRASDALADAAENVGRALRLVG